MRAILTLLLCFGLSLQTKRRNHKLKMYRNAIHDEVTREENKRLKSYAENKVLHQNTRSKPGNDNWKHDHRRHSLLTLKEQNDLISKIFRLSNQLSNRMCNKDTTERLQKLSPKCVNFLRDHFHDTFHMNQSQLLKQHSKRKRSSLKNLKKSIDTASMISKAKDLIKEEIKNNLRKELKEKNISCGGKKIVMADDCDDDEEEEIIVKRPKKVKTIVVEEEAPEEEIIVKQPPKEKTIAVEEAPQKVVEVEAPTETVVQQAPTQVVQEAPTTVVQEAPKVVQQPTVVEQEPTVVQAAPPAVQTSPPIVQQAPAVVQQQPSIVQQSPPAVVQQPPAVVQQPPAVVQQPPAVVQQPGSAVVQQPPLDVGVDLSSSQRLKAKEGQLLNDAISELNRIKQLEQAANKGTKGILEDNTGLLQNNNNQGTQKHQQNQLNQGNQGTQGNQGNQGNQGSSNGGGQGGFNGTPSPGGPLPGSGALGGMAPMG